MPNAECRMPNAECRVPNAGGKMPDAECRMPNGKRRTGGAAFAALALTLLCQLAAAAPKLEDEIPPRLNASLSRGLVFLAKQQNSDGSFDGGAPKVATTGLATLAFLAAGDAPDVGKYGLVVHNSIGWLLVHQAQDGYFGNGDRGMYAHAIATLALTQAYGVEPDMARRIRMHAAMERAVAIILAAQNAPKSNPVFAGGWRYERNSPDSDLSLSGWNSMALRGAAAVGIDVPGDARKRAAAFVVHCFDANAKAFGYQPGNAPQPGETAIGVLCLYLLDAVEGNAARLDAASKYLESHPIDDNSPFPYYATYYATQASFQRGGETWTRVGRPALERLIRLQDKDGGWPQSKSGQEPGRVYATAMALQALAVPYRLLPVYQR
jgi:hypothetical protein